VIFVKFCGLFAFIISAQMLENESGLLDFVRGRLFYVSLGCRIGRRVFQYSYSPVKPLIMAFSEPLIISWAHAVECVAFSPSCHVV